MLLHLPTRLLLYWGVTRDSALWLWSRIVALSYFTITTGFIDLDALVGKRWSHVISGAMALVLFASGKWDNSPLPSAKSHALPLPVNPA